MPQVLHKSARPVWKKKVSPTAVFTHAKDKLGIELPHHRGDHVFWKEVSDDVLLSVARSLALDHGIRSWQQFSGEIPSVRSALKDRNLRAAFCDFLHKIPQVGKNFPPSASTSFLFIQSALIKSTFAFDPILAKTSIPLGPRGRRLFGNVSDQHLYSVACAVLSECPSIKTPDDLKHHDSSLVKTLKRRGILEHLPFENPGRPKIRWKEKSPEQIRDLIQKYVDDNLICGPEELERHYSGFMRQIRNYRIKIVYHKKSQIPRATTSDAEDFDDES